MSAPMSDSAELRAAVDLVHEAYIDFATKLPKYPIPSCAPEQEILERAIQSAVDKSGAISNRPK